MRWGAIFLSTARALQLHDARHSAATWRHSTPAVQGILACFQRHKARTPAMQDTMQEKYQPAAVETAAQQHWDSSDAFRVTEDTNKP